MKTYFWQILFIVVTAVTGQAATIDFEEINGIIPFEGMAISNQFQPYFGMSFRRAPGAIAWPLIARVGSPRTAFDRNGGNPDDTPKSTPELFGDFFLTDNVGQGGSDRNLIIDFDAPVSQASGYVLDIDGGEQVLVSAYADGTGTNPLETLVFTAGLTAGTGDGVGTFWSFSRATNDILRIEIAPNGAPVGYDLFSSNYQPPPATPATLALRVYAGITIRGDIGRPYRIDYADGLDTAPRSTNWHTLTNFFLPSSPYRFYDSSPLNPGERFYRAIGLP